MRTTWQVSFNRKAGVKIKIDTIEDFILFIEAVEQQYPAAKPRDVVSEIRELWYSDVNWELLVSSEGIRDGGAVDIDTAPNPVALMFDMKDLAPASGGKRLATRMGEVDIGHLMAGIDAALSGFPPSYPKSNLSAHGHDDSDAELKYQTLSKASGGDSRDFTTWAGDLGQAYAEFLVSRYVKSEKKPLTDFVSDKAPDAELLGDIHGYIAQEVWKKAPASASPTGGEFKISNVVRDLYLVDTSAGPGGATYRDSMEIVSGKTGADLRTFVRDRSIAFARPWFAKKAVEHRGWLGSSGFTKKGILGDALAEFDTTHTSHDAAASPADKIDSPVDHFMKMLADSVK